MTDTLEDLVRQGEALYEQAVNRTLSGYQIVEEQLKGYIGIHFDSTRALLGDKLHFGFRREDYDDAALGRLVQVFSKLCSNGPLVARLRAVVERRNYVAHKAFLKLYQQGISPMEYSRLIDELRADMNEVNELMNAIRKEINVLLKTS